MTTDNINIKLTADTGQAVQSTENYKKTLKDLKDQMTALEVQTNGLTTATEEQKRRYAELEKQAGQISDAISDVSARIKANADDYQNFNATLQGLGAATAIVQGLTGQLELLGVTNVGAEKLVKTFMALQGQLNAINQLQKVFNKDSELMVAIQKRLNSAIESGGASMQMATKAQKALNAAMKAAPYIAIAAAIISVVSALANFIKETGNAADAQDALGKNTAAANAELERQRYLTGQAAQDTKVAMETLIQMAKEAGGNQTKLNAIYEQFHKQTGFNVRSIQDMNSAMTLWNNVVGKNTKTVEDLKAANDALKESNAELTEKTIKLGNELQQLTEGSGSYQLVLNEINKANKQKLANDAQIAANTKTITQLEAKNKITLEEFNEESKKRLGLDKEKNTSTQVRAKLTKEEIELLKIIDFTERTHYANSIKYQDQITDSLREQMNERQTLIENNKEYGKMVQSLKKESEDFANETLKGNEKIIAKYAERIEEVKKLGFTEEQTAHLIKILLRMRSDEMTRYWDGYNKQAKERTLQTNEEIKKLQLSNLEEGTPEYYNKKKELEDAQYEIELEELQTRRDNELISLEEYLTIKDELYKKHSNNIQQIDEEEKQNKIKNILEVLDTISFYAEQAGKIIQASSNFVMALQDAELENAEGDEKKQKEIKKKYAVANMMMTIGQIAVETIMGSVSALANGIRDMGMPVGAIVGGITAALVTATGIAATVKAVREKNNIMKMAKGGLIVGPSHSEGGVPYELEGGEAVLNKKAMAIPQYRSLASAMNVSTGGVAFPGTSGGGLLSATIDDRVVDSIVSRTVAAVTAIPVVVSEESITDAQRKVGVLEGRSRLG